MKLGIKEVNTDNPTTATYTIHVINGIGYVALGNNKSKDSDEKLYIMPPFMVKDMILEPLNAFCNKYSNDDIEMYAPKCPEIF